MSLKHTIKLLPGIILAFAVYYFVPGVQHPNAPYMAAIITLMAAWWVREVIPIPVTSVLPVFLFPIFNLGDLDTVCLNYGKPIIFLFLGGFILALGLQESGVHKRLALVIVNAIGSKPRQLILGFMVVTGFMSMWISNTASVMVMLPIGMSVLQSIRNEVGHWEGAGRFGICLMLGIAYSANIGGMATLIGTPPNLIFLEMYHQLFPEAHRIGFTEWMAIGFPLSLAFLIFGWLMLTRLIFILPSTEIFGKTSVIEYQLKELGRIRRSEVRSLVIFALAAVLWITGSDINISDHFTIRGWRSLLNLPLVSDPAIAMFASTLLFIIPSGEEKNKMLLSWSVTKELPWGILLLFGGGFAIAGGFEDSGLSSLVQSLFTGLPKLHPLILLTIICIFVTFLTEITSNSAATTLVLPILASGALVFETDPRLLMIPATLAASCAFMMPIATPPQAIVFGTGYVSIRQMMRAGIWFNLLGVILTMTVFTIVHLFFWK